MLGVEPMHTTSPWRAVSRVALVLGLFFTGCCFLDSWHAPFFFNFRYQWLKLILSFVIPAAVTVWNFLTERSLRFAGTACAVLMQRSSLSPENSQTNTYSPNNQIPWIK